MVAVVYPKVGGIVNVPNYLGSFTWATRPTASAALAGAVFYASDYPSYWFCDGTIWRPYGNARLQCRTIADAITNGTLTVINQQLIPAGMLKAGMILRVFHQTIKSSTGSSGTEQIYMGTAGTTADAALLANATTFGAANRQLAIVYDILRVTSTSVRVVTSGATQSYAANATPVPADVTVSDLDANDLYVSVAVNNTGGAETVTNRAFIVDMI